MKTFSIKWIIYHQYYSRSRSASKKCSQYLQFSLSLWYMDMPNVYPIWFKLTAGRITSIPNWAPAMWGKFQSLKYQVEPWVGISCAREIKTRELRAMTSGRKTYSWCCSLLLILKLDGFPPNRFSCLIDSYFTDTETEIKWTLGIVKLSFEYFFKFFSDFCIKTAKWYTRHMLYLLLSLSVYS